jgi:hypothetical protein
MENLRQINGAPSVQMAEIPPDLYFAYNQFNDDEVIDEAKEYENQQRYNDKHIVHDGELYDGEKDQDQTYLRYEFGVDPMPKLEVEIEMLKDGAVFVEPAVPAKPEAAK